MNPSAIDVFMFGVYPYIASAVFFIGSWIRYDREQYTWRAGSSQILHSRNFRIASILFHVGILAIFAGHFAGLAASHRLRVPGLDAERHLQELRPRTLAAPEQAGPEHAGPGQAGTTNGVRPKRRRRSR